MINHKLIKILQVKQQKK